MSLQQGVYDSLEGSADCLFIVHHPSEEFDGLHQLVFVSVSFREELVDLVAGEEAVTVGIEDVEEVITFIIVIGVGTGVSSLASVSRATLAGLRFRAAASTAATTSASFAGFRARSGFHNRSLLLKAVANLLGANERVTKSPVVANNLSKGLLTC